MADARDSRGRRGDVPVRSPDANIPTEAQREAAVERLSAAFAHDVLQLDEFEHRVAEAYRAATRAELIRLTADLPPSMAMTVEQTVRRLPDDAPSPLPARVKGRFSSIERGGFLAVPHHLEIVSHFANIELDLRTAEFLPGVSEIEIRAVLGNVEISLPPDVMVENEGDWVLSSVSIRRSTEHEGVYPVATVRITGRAVLSNIELQGKVTKRGKKRT